MTGDGARRDQGRLASDQEETVMAARRGAPRWALLLSWIVAVVVWLWLINDLILQGLPETSVLASAGAEMLLNGLFSLVVATVVAAFAMFLVRLIGRGVVWLKLRFVKGE